MGTKYHIVTTEDGTCSLFSEEYNEAMHSISGAFQEALLKHVYPSRILECRNKELWVLDIGFGIGFNILALIMEFLKRDSSQVIHIVSLERDVSCLPVMKNIVFNDKRDVIYDAIKKAFKNGKLSCQRYNIRLIFGDARESIKELNNIAFDAVFHDPYSPSKNPELWSVEFLKEVKRLISNRGILTTYSCAHQVRMALVEAGFCIGRGPSVGRKKEGTLAGKDSVILCLKDTEQEAIKRDIKSTPYRDQTLNDSRDNILKRRIEEMRLKRAK